MHPKLGPRARLSKASVGDSAVNHQSAKGEEIEPTVKQDTWVWLTVTNGDDSPLY